MLPCDLPARLLALPSCLLVLSARVICPLSEDVWRGIFDSNFLLSM